MEWSNFRPRVFQIGAVYFAARRDHDLDVDDKFYLVLGPSKRTAPSAYHATNDPVEYQYLDLLTGEIDDFHRDSYFAERAELFG